MTNRVRITIGIGMADWIPAFAGMTYGAGMTYEVGMTEKVGMT